MKLNIPQVYLIDISNKNVGCQCPLTSRIAKPYRENISKSVTFYNPNRMVMNIILNEYLFIDENELRSIKKKLKENKHSRLEINLIHPFDHKVI
jgi:hypothetical protein